MAIGPIQMVVIEFTGDEFASKVLPELRAIGLSGAVRLVGLRFMRKDARGRLSTFDGPGLTEEERKRSHALAWNLVELGGGAEAVTGALVGPQSAVSQDFGFTRAQVQHLGDLMANNSTAAIALFEHVWAGNLRQDVRDAGGRILAEGLMTPEALLALGEELTTLPA